MDAAIPIRDTRKAGHFWADNEIVDDYLPAIGLHGFALYMLLCKYAGANGRCFPSITTLTKKLAVSAPTIRKALATLQGAHLIDINSRDNNGKTTTNEYVILTVPKRERGKGDLPLKEVGVNVVDPSEADRGKPDCPPGVNVVDPIKKNDLEEDQDKEVSLGVPKETAIAVAGATPIAARPEPEQSEITPPEPEPAKQPVVVQSTLALMESGKTPTPPMPPAPPSPLTLGQSVLWHHQQTPELLKPPTPAVVYALSDNGHCSIACLGDHDRPHIVTVDKRQLEPRAEEQGDGVLRAYRNGNGHIPAHVPPVPAPVVPLGDPPSGYRWVVSAGCNVAHLARAGTQRARALCKATLGDQGTVGDGAVICVECMARAEKPKKAPERDPLFKEVARYLHLPDEPCHDPYPANTVKRINGIKGCVMRTGRDKVTKDGHTDYVALAELLEDFPMWCKTKGFAPPTNQDKFWSNFGEYYEKQKGGW